MTVAGPKPRPHLRRLPDWARSARARPRADKQFVPVLGLIALVLVAGGVLWLTLAWLERVATVQEDLAERWGRKYGAMIRLWRNA